MIRTPRFLNAKLHYPLFLSSEYNKKLDSYNVDLEKNFRKTTRHYVTTTCVTIPIGDINLIIQMHGIDETSRIKFDMGKIQSEHFSRDYVTIVELSLSDGMTIININELYRTLDGNGKSFNSDNHIMTIETIQKICNALFTQYFCNRDSEFESELPHMLDYNEYLYYLEF